MLKEISKIRYLYYLFPEKIAYAIGQIPQTDAEFVQEIRLRRDRFVTVKAFSKEYFLSANGLLMNQPQNSIKVTAETIETIFRRIFKDSIHSHKRELTAGYMTLPGGSRAGFCGTAYLNSAYGYRVENVKDISSINVRIAKEVIGCAEEIYKRAFLKGLKSLLIAGPPASGKTTVLRDLSRMLGETESICLIDERNEIAACWEGSPQNNVGVLTDVFTCYNKYEGIMTAVKVMSPQLLICDEIGSKEDYEALEYALNSGVKIIASCHCNDYSDLKRKSIISKLIKDKAFDCCAILGTGSMCGKMVSFSKIGGSDA